jgi:hypothetical protein
LNCSSLTATPCWKTPHKFLFRAFVFAVFSAWNYFSIFLVYFILTHLANISLNYTCLWNPSLAFQTRSSVLYISNNLYF